jgi:hypothetical protein
VSAANELQAIAEVLTELFGQLLLPIALFLQAAEEEAKY